MEFLVLVSLGSHSVSTRCPPSFYTGLIPTIFKLLFGSRGSAKLSESNARGHFPVHFGPSSSPRGGDGTTARLHVPASVIIIATARPQSRASEGRGQNRGSGVHGHLSQPGLRSASGALILSLCLFWPQKEGVFLKCWLPGFIS